MSKSKSSRSSRSAKRRERKKAPRDTPFPLPPSSLVRVDGPYSIKVEHFPPCNMTSATYPFPVCELPPYPVRPFRDCAIRTTCMMERERWA